MTELKLNVTKDEYWCMREEKSDKFILPSDIQLEPDYDRVRFVYRTRSVLRDYEGISAGVLHIGDRIKLRTCSGENE